VTEGKITIDDQEISSLNLYDLRNSIGIVPQDAFLWILLRVTLNLVRRDATDEEVESAAKSAVVHDNIIGFTRPF
jgi:ATP-binding cassette subfamily B protein